MNWLVTGLVFGLGLGPRLALSVLGLAVVDFFCVGVCLALSGLSLGLGLTAFGLIDKPDYN